MTPEQELCREIASFDADPLGFVQYAYPWGSPGELEDYAGPWEWQRDILNTIGKHLRSPQRFEPLLIAVASGHGVGKSCLLSWLTGWGISTCPDARILVTANTGDQLRTKTIPEMSKWFRLGINRAWWEPGSESIRTKDRDHEKTWRADFMTWSLERTEAFAGLHNKGKRIVLIFDEASAIPDKIWEVAEGAMTDEGTEIIWLVFGNPTMNTGRFRECWGRYKRRWIQKQIDSRKVPGTNKVQIQKWIDDYGEDSDFVRVRVKGEFPRAGSVQFISSEVVAEARRRKVGDQSRAWPIISVDVARFGDDQTIIGKRQGLRFTVLEKLRGLSTDQVAMRTMLHCKEENARACIVDGDGVGGGVVDYMRLHLGPWMEKHPMFRLEEFHGAGMVNDRDMYYNARAEAWGLMRNWLETAEIPDDPELEIDLTGPEYFFSAKNTIQLESKDDMKKRGLYSPDCFIAGTMIRTPHGERPIEEIKKGDFVITPFGPSRVEIAHESLASSLTTATFSNGKSLIGKGQHKIFTWRGPRRLDTLTMTDQFELWSTWRHLKWRLASLFYTNAKSFGFKQAIDTFSQGEQIRLKDFCIAGFGSTTLAQSLMVCTSTIKTAIGEIIRYPISNLWTVPIMQGCICLNGTPRPQDIRNQLMPSRLLESTPQSGTAPMQGKSGTPRTANECGAPKSWFQQFVSGVGKLSRLLSLLGRCFVQTVASRKPLTLVEAVQTVNESATTYNLTLREHNAYWANGVLVFNCGDCLAMTFYSNPQGRSRDERLLEEIQAADPWKAHFMRLAETERRAKANTAKGWWE